MNWRKIFLYPRRSLFYLYFTLLGLGATRPIQIIGTHARPYLTWKVFRVLRLRETRAPSQLAFQCIDATTTDASNAINGRCTDISKVRIADAFAKCFGYPLAVDPLSHCGPMVEKSDKNAAHDGRIIEGPIATQTRGKVYARFIDTEHEGLVEDLRPCIVGREIPFVYRKRRPAAARFDNVTPFVRAVRADRVFTASEQDDLVAFAREIGMDIGELDVLRDRHSGRIYVVDANKTPNSPGAAYFSVGAALCMHRAAAAFRRQFLSAPAHKGAASPVQAQLDRG